MPDAMADDSGAPSRSALSMSGSAERTRSGTKGYATCTARPADSPEPSSVASTQTTVAPERSHVQRMEALQRANDIRTRRAQLKRDLRAGHVAIHPYHRGVTRRMVDQAHEVGLAVNVWTVDDPIRMRSLARIGVDALITNVPAVGVETFRSRDSHGTGPA